MKPRRKKAAFRLLQPKRPHASQPASLQAISAGACMFVHRMSRKVLFSSYKAACISKTETIHNFFTSLPEVDRHHDLTHISLHKHDLLNPQYIFTMLMPIQKKRPTSMISKHNTTSPHLPCIQKNALNDFPPKQQGQKPPTPSNYIPPLLLSPNLPPHLSAPTTSSPHQPTAPYSPSPPT